MIAIAFTGLARSGKDAAADYLAERYGFEKLVMSDELALELAKQGKEDTKMNRSRMGKELRQRFGDDIVAQRVFEKALKNKLEKVVFVGPRSVSEIEFFRKKIQGFRLVAIKASPEKRFERKSAADGQTKEKFFERDRHDSTAFELKKVIEMADCTIENNATIEEFRMSIGRLMRRLPLQKL